MSPKSSLTVLNGVELRLKKETHFFPVNSVERKEASCEVEVALRISVDLHLKKMTYFFSTKNTVYQESPSVRISINVSVKIK